MAHALVVRGVLVVTVVLGIADASEAAEKTIVLEEHLKIGWKGEFVTYPFEADEGQCHVESVTLSGPTGQIPCQLSDVTFWPESETSVKTAKLSFIVNLAPLAIDTYTVRYGTKPAELPTADLVIKPGKDEVEISTALFAAKLLLGRKSFSPPAAAESVPGPIAAMHMEDSEWFGGSRMYGKTKINAYEARLVVDGPVFAEARTRYTYEDGNMLELTFHVAAGDSAVLIDADVKKTNAQDGWHMIVGDDRRPLTFRMQAEAYPKRGATIGQWVSVPLDREPPGLITRLTPWHDWFDDYTQTIIRLQMPETNRELRITRRDSGAWVTPGPMAKFGGDGMLGRKRVDLMRSESGEIFLRLDHVEGERKWAFENQPTPGADLHNFVTTGRFQVIRDGRVGRQLNEVKDYVLDWDVKTPHPHLFMTRAELEQAWQRKPDPETVEELLTISERSRGIGSGYAMSMGLGAWLMTGDAEAAKRATIVERLRMKMAQLGEFDTMNGGGFTCSIFDTVMGSGLVPEKERKLLWARFAYLGYRMAHPDTWSMERGYCSGNLNMSVTSNMHLGLVACTIPDHPMAKTWIKPARLLFEEMMANNVGPAGEWPESIANYMHVSTAPLLYFAIAATNAGLGDLVNDDRLKRLLLYNAMQYTPPDPRHTELNKGGTSGLLPPIGRGPAGKSNGLVGAMARATAKSDPAYSRKLQWVWLRSGQPMRIPADRFGGWERVYMDPTLPAEKPDWQMNVFPRTGVLMRHGLGTPDEWYAYLVCENKYTVPTESGAMAMVFAKGAPISARGVSSYPDREELLLSRVLLARPRGDLAYRSINYTHEAKRQIASASALASQHYALGDFTIDQPGRPMTFGDPETVSFKNWRQLPEWPKVTKEGKPGVKWRRQVLFVRDTEPAGVNYFVLRDTVTGGQPTMWQFWTVSEKMGTPDQISDREAFLADAPGNKTTEPRQLPQSDRYTAAGQFDVDVEFYIAEPTDAPRHTLRFGVPTHAYASLTGFQEYQDLLHLQRPDNGAYFVVIYPRRQKEEVPQFATMDDGKIIKVSGRFGSDLCFLSEEPINVSAEGAKFEGTAGSVQDRNDGVVLSLGAKGRVAYQDYSISGDGAAALRVGEDTLVLEFPPNHPGVTVRIQTPGLWVEEKGSPGTAIRRVHNGNMEIRANKGVRTIRLVKP